MATHDADAVREALTQMVETSWVGNLAWPYKPGVTDGVRCRYCSTHAVEEMALEHKEYCPVPRARQALAAAPAPAETGRVVEAAQRLVTAKGSGAYLSAFNELADAVSAMTLGGASIIDRLNRLDVARPAPPPHRPPEEGL